MMYDIQENGGDMDYTIGEELYCDDCGHLDEADITVCIDEEDLEICMDCAVKGKYITEDDWSAFNHVRKVWRGE